MSSAAFSPEPRAVVPDFFVNLIRYREYLKQSVARDLKRAYKRSALGYLWSMLNPLLMMIILTVVFSHLMRVQVEHYSVFLLTALLPWQYFQQTVLGSMDSIRANRKLLEQVPVPKYLFVLSLATSNLVNFLLSLVPLLLVTLVVGKSLSWSMLALPFILLPIFFFSFGVAIFTATLHVFFSDIRHLLQVGLQALYYLTPILYGRDHLPAGVARWLEWNPMYHLIELMRAAFYYNHLPSAESYGIALLLGLGALLLGLYTLRRVDEKLMYFL